MIIDVSTYIAEKILRSDILTELSHDGVEAIIDWYDSIDENIRFDQSLFWGWCRYSSAIEAVNDLDSSVIEDIVNGFKETLDEGEHVEEDDVEMECKDWLSDNKTIIVLDNGDVLVDTDS